MSNMVQLVAEMRARLNEITKSEQALVQTLEETLNRIDQKLLQDMQNVATERESRRGSLLYELQCLAARIGAFPTADDSMATIENASPETIPAAAANSIHPPSTCGGDWRQAVNNIEADPDARIEKRISSN
jgi:hypothetical protein